MNDNEPYGTASTDNTLPVVLLDCGHWAPRQVVRTAFDGDTPYALCPDCYQKLEVQNNGERKAT
jgi:hypothetical protein